MQQSVVDLRRERDAIRVEMERLVRTMQGLETDVEQRRPGWETKRDELSQCRQQLSDLRARMRSVMEGVGVPTGRSGSTGASSSSSSLNAAPASIRRQYDSNSSPAPRVSQPGTGDYGAESSTVSPTRSRNLPSGPTYFASQQHGSTSFISTTSQKSSPVRSSRSIDRPASSPTRHRSDAAAGPPDIQHIERRQSEEKRQFQLEIARLSEEMERRHETERRAALAMLQEEEEKRREVALATERLERAQRALESIRRSHAATAPSTPSGPSELDQLRRRYRPVPQDGLNSSLGAKGN